ncbi:hypothetical protein FKP32DRAFT_1557020, partial [Trametes sanguinea]
MSCLLFDLAIEPLAAKIRASSIKGITIPGLRDRLVTKMFADDTAMYLCEEDKYEEVHDVTLVWCRGARAKFNLTKTEVIPLGTVEYRERVVATRKLNEDSQPIPAGVKIAEDGESVRLLGAWIGNRTNDAAPWERVLSTLDGVLDKWNTRNPSLHGRKLILGMEVAGRTQFLAKAQGMPESILKRLQRMMAAFLWNGKAPTVAVETLHTPVSAGGLGLLNLKHRNDAIELLWLKHYLDLSSSR